MIAVVMQPTYLPWIGYFDLIDQADVFVILDTVQFAKQSWQQRNRIKTPQGPLWLTVPVHQSLHQSIKDVRIDDKSPWRKKHWASLVANYGKSPYWSAYAPRLEAVYAEANDSLAELNVRLIATLKAMIGVDARFLRTSEMLPIDESKVEALVALCRHVGADVYLSPPGSFDYLQSEAPFEAHGIRLAFQQFAHPVYAQRFGDFVPYMSAIDLLFQCGPGALDVLRSGRREWKSAAEMAAASGSTEKS
jgi:hypothetical protein